VILWDKAGNKTVFSYHILDTFSLQFLKLSGCFPFSGSISTFLFRFALQHPWASHQHPKIVNYSAVYKILHFWTFCHSCSKLFISIKSKTVMSTSLIFPAGETKRETFWCKMKNGRFKLLISRSTPKSKRQNTPSLPSLLNYHLSQKNEIFGLIKQIKKLTARNNDCTK